MTVPSAQPSATISSEAQQTSIWEDFIDIIIAPARVFRRRDGGSWGKPLLIVTLAITVLAIAGRGVLRPAYDAEFERQAEVMRKNPQVTEDMIERTRTIGSYATLVGVPIIIPITIMVVGFLLWIAGKLVGATEELGTAIMVAAYAMVPRVIQAVVNLVQGLVMDPTRLTGLMKLSISPARFLDPATTSPVVIQMLNRLDLFTVWATVLLGIGLYVTGRVSKGRATVAAIIVWLIAAVPPLLGALRQASA